MRKLLILVLCGFVHRGACTRVRFEQFHDPMCRQDSHIPGDAVYKREHFFPRDAIVQPEQIMPQQGMMRNEQVYGNERVLSSPQQQAGFPNGEFLPNEQLETIIPNDAYIRADPILRREPFIRREPLFRRDAFIRREPLIRGRMYQNAPLLQNGQIPLVQNGQIPLVGQNGQIPLVQNGGMFRNEPNPYAMMMTQCQCQEAPRMEPNPPQETFFQISPPMQQQPLMIIPKQSIKAQVYQPFLPFPRFQRFVRKSFKPVADNIQFAPPTVQTPAEFGTFTNEPVPFPASFQTQGSQPENTSEPSQNKPVTVRTVQQMPNALTLAQMSSIC